MIEQALPELLLLDIGMPVLDGFAVIRKNSRESSLGATAGSGSHRVCHARRSGKNPQLRV